MKTENPVILFDGFCNLCSGLVTFLLKVDVKKQFRFIPLQSEKGQKLIGVSKWCNPSHCPPRGLLKQKTVALYPSLTYNISMVFIEIPVFTEDLLELLSDDEYKEM